MTEEDWNCHNVYFVLCNIRDPFLWQDVQQKLIWLKKLGKTFFFCKTICDMFSGVMYGGKDYKSCYPWILKVWKYCGMHVVLLPCTAHHLCSYQVVMEAFASFTRYQL